MIALGLGSSDRDALSWLRRTVAALKAERSLRIRRISPIYESDALLPKSAPASWNVPYLNLVVAVQPVRDSLTPHQLLDYAKSLEKRLGRKERERWAPREIDIDLLAWGGTRINTELLSLPHPGLLERPFALLPLADAAPELMEFMDPETRSLLSRWLAPGAAVPFRTRKRLDRLTELVTVLNLTPDSFSDGGRINDENALLSSAQAAIAAGATVLDIGAESTRPGASPVSPDEEWRRLAPALKSMAQLRTSSQGPGPGFKLSLDSRHGETIARALETGIEIDWLNDVTGFISAQMRDVARGSRADLVVMHSLGVPPERGLTLALDEDPVQTVLEWGFRKLEELAQEGIDPARVILDPGIGFGKTPAQNLRLLQHAQRLHAWGTRILIGHSRKSFIAALATDSGSNSEPNAAPAERDLETALISARLADQGVEYLRVHDPRSQARALRLSAAWDGTAFC